MEPPGMGCNMGPIITTTYPLRLVTRPLSQSQKWIPCELGGDHDFDIADHQQPDRASAAPTGSPPCMDCDELESDCGRCANWSTCMRHPTSLTVSHYIPHPLHLLTTRREGSPYWCSRFEYFSIPAAPTYHVLSSYKIYATYRVYLQLWFYQHNNLATYHLDPAHVHACACDPHVAPI